MPRPSKLPAFRTHLVEKGYSLTTCNAYIWAVCRTMDKVPDPTDETLRAYFETLEATQRSLVRTAWRAMAAFLRVTQNVETPLGDPVAPEYATATPMTVPRDVVTLIRTLRTQKVSARKALALLVGDLRRFNDKVMIDLHNGAHAVAPSAQVDAVLAWGYPAGDAQPGDPLFATPEPRQPLPYGVLLSALQKYA